MARAEHGDGGRIAVRVRISGLVQGVWFRAWTQERAWALGLSGWVRNRRDGTVEALFAGPEEAVREMVDACRQGPPGAEVAKVQESPALDPGKVGFAVRPTA